MANLKIGDKVRVNDPGLLMMQSLMKKMGQQVKPNNEGVILEIWDDDRMYLIDFPIGDDDPKEHSQSAPYPKYMVQKID